MSNKEVKLAGKLLKILSSLDNVPKKGFNHHQNYHYTREVDVLEALKKSLVENKVVLLTSSEVVRMDPQEKVDKNGNKKTEYITTVKTSHTFLDAESGEERTITSVGSGYDSTDKGAYKAITGAVKYALMKTFLIGDEGADAENDGEKREETNKPTVQSFGTQKSFSSNTANKTKTTGTSSTTGFGRAVQATSNGQTEPATEVVSETKAVDTSQVTEKVTKPAQEKPTFASRTKPNYLQSN